MENTWLTLVKGAGQIWQVKSKAEVYVNQDKSLSDLQTLIKHSFLLYFPHELLMNFLNIFQKLINNS